MGVGTTLSPFNEELTMNATNENKCLSRSSRVRLATRQRRILVAVALSGLAFLGITLVTAWQCRFIAADERGKNQIVILDLRSLYLENGLGNALQIAQ
jgi:hypothetical protein